MKDFNFKEFVHDWHLSGVVTTLILIVGLAVLRFILVRTIYGKSEILTKDQRRWITHIKNAVWVSFVIGLMLIWAPQLQTFALSLTAFTAALVIATKELILCLSGSFMHFSTRPYKIGDWVTIAGVSGEVIDTNIFATTVHEIDRTGKSFQFTGRTVQIPNSWLLSNTVHNENHIRNYSFYDFTITVQYADLSPTALMKKLKDITEKHFAPFRDEARSHNRRIERKSGVDLAETDPEFFIRTTDLAHNVYGVRLFLPTREATIIGARITEDFLAYVHAEKVKKAAKEAEKAA